MICPDEDCEGRLKKARLDVYWCKECDSVWLIHRLSYKSLEEASEISDEKTFQQNFLDPLFRVPP